VTAGEEKAGPLATTSSSTPAAAAPAPTPAESIAEMNARHLKMLRAIQGKALEALRGGQFGDAAEAAKALAIVVREERRIRGATSLSARRLRLGLR